MSDRLRLAQSPVSKARMTTPHKQKSPLPLAQSKSLLDGDTDPVVPELEQSGRAKKWYR